MRQRSCIALLAAGLIAFAGCGPAKLDVSKTVTIDGPPKLVLLDPQPKPQKITIEFECTAADTTVTVLLVKKADCAEDDASTFPTDKAIAFKKDKSATFSGDLPEKTEGMVIVRGGQKTDVKLHITNK